MQSDPAAFRDGDLLAVYGPSPVCFQTAKRHGQDGQPIDKHHVMGRGGKDPDDRRIHSSVFNCGLLRRDVHEGPLRDDPAQRTVYLKVAYRHGMAAVGGGRYELREEDRAFLRLYQKAA